MDDAQNLVENGARVECGVTAFSPETRGLLADRRREHWRADVLQYRAAKGSGGPTTMHHNHPRYFTFDNQGVLTMFIRSGTVIVILGAIIIYLLVR